MQKRMPDLRGIVALLAALATAVACSGARSVDESSLAASTAELVDWVDVSRVAGSQREVACPSGRDDPGDEERIDCAFADKRFGLTWTGIKPGKGAKRRVPLDLTWGAARSWCRTLDAWAGHSDWRLPTRAELRTAALDERGRYRADGLLRVMDKHPGFRRWQPFTLMWTGDIVKSSPKMAWAVMRGDLNAADTVATQSQPKPFVCVRGPRLGKAANGTTLALPAARSGSDGVVEAAKAAADAARVAAEAALAAIALARDVVYGKVPMQPKTASAMPVAAAPPQAPALAPAPAPLPKPAKPKSEPPPPAAVAAVPVALPAPLAAIEAPAPAEVAPSPAAVAPPAPAPTNIGTTTLSAKPLLSRQKRVANRLFGEMQDRGLGDAVDDAGTLHLDEETGMPFASNKARFDDPEVVTRVNTFLVTWLDSVIASVNPKHVRRILVTGWACPVFNGKLKAPDELTPKQRARLLALGRTRAEHIAAAIRRVSPQLAERVETLGGAPGTFGPTCALHRRVEVGVIVDP